MNPLLHKLQPYPFEKLKQLKQAVSFNGSLNHIALSIGEPKHQPPQQVLNAWKDALPTVSVYPKTAGREDLKDAIINWLESRFSLSKNSLNQQQVLPLNGTREGLFSFVQAIADNSKDNAKILMPNPFYQIYEGAALLAGVEPYFIPCLETNNFLADIEGLVNTDEQALKDCQILFICTPG
ncbi:MAG: aminotransferase class I/II-fold pyridoxal phosphate-dependent enzyme, partial [Sinobacterium sp.]|nr:aminotransferase class I/II-fold pyridoxal phosphate-dependent enzyme [Sinobacterium sp.]